MRKKLLVIFMSFVLVGCFKPEYIEDATISKYTIDKYSEVLRKHKIDEFKCVPTDNGYKVYYFLNKKPNDFPATILLEGINGTYNVYFDKEYRSIPKNNLITDIDGCFNELETTVLTDTSWN